MLTDHWPWSILLFVMPSPLLRYSFVNILYRRSNSHEVSTIKQKWCNNPEFLECVKILKTRHSKEILMLNSQFKYFTRFLSRSAFRSIVHSWIYICIYGILRSILSWISMTQLKYNNYLYFATKISKYCFKDFKYNPLLCHHISWYYTDMSPYPLIWCWYVRLKMRLHSPSKFLTPCASSLVAPSPIFLCIFHHMSIICHHICWSYFITCWSYFIICRSYFITCWSYFIKSRSDFHQISILLFLLLQLFKLYLFPNLCANPVIITCIENSILFKFKCYDNGWSCKFLSDPGVPGPIFVSGYPSVRQWVKHIVLT